MAQTGYTPILIYASGTTGNTPSASNLTSSSAGAELALNYFDGKLFYKDASGVVQVLAGKGGTGVVAGSNTQVQFNNNGVFGASSGLTWDGTNLTASQLRSSGLTSGRVAYASTSGLLVDSANMTFNGTRLTVADLADSSLTSGRVTYATTGGNLTDSANLVFDGTNLGVGTSSPAQKLQVSGTSAATYALVTNAGTGPSNLFLGAGNAVTQIISQDASTGVVPLSFLLGTTEQMRLTSTGLGIGTSSPAAKLHVIGDAGSSPASSGTTQTGDYARLQNSGSGLTLDIGGWGGNGNWLQSTNTSDLSLTYALLLNPIGGNVGIGTLSPTARLTVAGNILSTSTAGTDSFVNVATSGVQNTFLGFNNSGSTNAYGVANNFSYLGNANAYGLQFVANGGVVGTFTTLGNLGIGTSSPGARVTVAGGRLQVTGNTAPSSGAGVELFYDGVTAGALAFARGTGYLPVALDGSEVRLFTNSTERARITSTGQLGVGTTSFQNQSPAGSISFPTLASIQTGSFGRAWNPAQQIGQASNAGLYGMAHTYLAYYDSGWKSLGGGTASAITIDEGVFSFSSSNSVGASGSALTWTSRMIVGATGFFLLGTSTTSSLHNTLNNGFQYFPSSWLSINATNEPLLLTTQSVTAFTRFYYRDTGQVGSIAYNGAGVNYNTTSDYRLKEDVQPMTGALAKVAALKPCTYKWKRTGADGQGFIAHELAEVVPDCVTGEKDEVDADGKPVYQGIDTSFLVATLTAAIQELKAEFDAYKATYP